MGFRDRLSRAWDGFRGYKSPITTGELALADPLYLVGGAGSFAPFNPNKLVTVKGLAIFDEMRRDDQIKASLVFKKQAVLATGWDVSPAIQPKSERVGGKTGQRTTPVTPPETEVGIALPGDEVRDFVKKNLDGIEGTFERALLQIMTALDFGFSVTEKLFELRDDGKIWLTALKTKRPLVFRFKIDKFANLEAIIQDGNPQQELPPSKFIVFRHDYEFGNPYGTSDLDAAYRAWWTKVNAYKWMAMLLEKYGIPPIIALYDDTVYKGETIEALRTLLANLQASTVATAPRRDKDSLELWSPQLAGQVARAFIPAFDMMNRDIARALLMPGTLGLTPDKATGSYARAKVVFDLFMFVVEHLRREMENLVNETIVQPLVTLNFGTDQFPTFRFLPLTDEQQHEMLAQWFEAVKIAAVVPTPDDEEHIREQLEFPQRDPNAVGELPSPTESEVPGPSGENRPPSPKPKPGTSTRRNR